MKQLLILAALSTIGIGCGHAKLRKAAEVAYRMPIFPKAQERAPEKPTTSTAGVVFRAETDDVDDFLRELARMSTTGTSTLTESVAEDIIARVEFGAFATTTGNDLRILLYVKNALLYGDGHALQMMAASQLLSAIDDVHQRAFWWRVVIVATFGLSSDCRERSVWWDEQFEVWSRAERRAFAVTMYYMKTRFPLRYQCVKRVRDRDGRDTI